MKYNKQVSFGYDKDGKRIRKWFHANTLKELSAQIEDYRTELKRVANPSSVTFKEYSEQWLNVYKMNRAKQTIEMYQYALRKCDDLDPYPIKKITKSMCQATINASWDYPSAAEDLASTLKQIFKCAQADGIIATSPADALTLPKKPQSKFYLLTEDDLAKIKKTDLNETDRLFVTILQVFGLRPAEALALNPSDFDWTEKVLRITKSVELSNDNKSRIKSTKTGTVRDIPIPDAIIPYLQSHIRGKKTLLLFAKADNTVFTKSAYRRLSERLLKAFGIPKMTLYSFRHRRATDLYYLTQQAGSGITTKYAASILGHSEMVFLNTYSHVDMNQESKDIYKNFNFQAVTNL